LNLDKKLILSLYPLLTTDFLHVSIGLQPRALAEGNCAIVPLRVAFGLSDERRPTRDKTRKINHNSPNFASATANAGLSTGLAKLNGTTHFNSS